MHSLRPQPRHPLLTCRAPLLPPEHCLFKKEKKNPPSNKMMVMITFDPCEFFSTFSTSALALLPALLVQRLAPDFHHHHHDGNDDHEDNDDDDYDKWE